jgi:hypothetical protein
MKRTIIDALTGEHGADQPSEEKCGCHGSWLVGLGDSCLLPFFRTR